MSFAGFMIVINAGCLGFVSLLKYTYKCAHLVYMFARHGLDELRLTVPGGRGQEQGFSASWQLCVRLKNSAAFS